MATKAVQLLTALVAPAQDLENVIQQFLANRFVDTAVGAQLDIIGAIVGEDRNGLIDNDYRRYIRAKIAVNNSNGVFEDLLTIAFLVIYDASATYIATDVGTATVVLRVGNITLTDALGNILATFLQKAVSAGVRIVTEWSNSLPASTFRLDSGPGLNQGHLASAAG